MIIIYTKWHIAVMCMMRDMQNVIYMYTPTYKWRHYYTKRHRNVV